MSLIYDQKILDLGPHGVLGLTLDSAYSTPLPAHKFGFARWRDATGKEHDRLALCTRTVPKVVLVKLLSDLREKYAIAAQSARDRVEWAFTEVCDDYLEAPTAVFPIEEGIVLLVFGATSPQIFRLVDIVRSQVLWEESLDNVRKRLKIKVPGYMRMMPHDSVTVRAYCLRHICLLTGATINLLRVTGIGFEEVKLALGNERSIEDPYLLKSALLMVSRETGEIAIAQFGATNGILVYSPAVKRNGMSGVACAVNADRFALSTAGGSIEVVNGNGGLERILRPFPRLGSRDQVGIWFSPSGRFLVAAAQDEVLVLDLEHATGKIKTARAALPDCNVATDCLAFSAEVRYRADWAVTDEGGYVLANKAFTFTPFGKLNWKDSSDLVVQGGPSHKPVPPGLEQTIMGWRKPALELRPTTKAKGRSRSKLYGLPHLPAGVEWPRHEGSLMVLLCQIDCGEVPRLQPDSPLPDHGGLLFFVAVDDEGYPLEDEYFNPAASKVMWVETLADVPLDPDDALKLEEQAIELEPNASDLPQTEAEIVVAANLPHAEFECYRLLIEETLPEGATAGHRLGGYPHLLQSNSLEAAACDAAAARSSSKRAGFAVPAKWRLLLQLDSDGELMWGTDSGMLYFMINDGDLALSDFSRVVALCEGC